MIRILSLDDDPGMLELIHLILQPVGYEHRWTTESAEAWAILHAEPVDLLTQDLMRPQLDGWEFYRRLQSDDVLCDLPVLIITARAYQADKPWPPELTAVDGYLVKPFGPLELLAAVEWVLRRHGKTLPLAQQRAALHNLFHLPSKTFTPERLEELVATLQTGERQLRVSAAWELSFFEDERAVNALLNVLEYGDRWIRLSAIRALGHLGDTRAVQALIETLLDETASERAAAALALARIRDQRAVEPLMVALQEDEAADVQAAAAWALGDIGDAQAVEPLIAALLKVKWIAARALIQIGTPVLAPLCRQLHTASQPALRQVVAEVLGQLSDPQATGPLTAALHDVEATVRATAAWYLGFSGDPQAVIPLVLALQDGEATVRRAAARALGRLRDARALEPLCTALQDEDSAVAREAGRALGWLHDPRALPALEQMRQRDHRQTPLGATLSATAEWAIRQLQGGPPPS